MAASKQKAENEAKQHMYDVIDSTIEPILRDYISYIFDKPIEVLYPNYKVTEPMNFYLASEGVVHTVTLEIHDADMPNIETALEHSTNPKLRSLIGNIHCSIFSKFIELLDDLNDEDKAIARTKSIQLRFDKANCRYEVIYTNPDRMLSELLENDMKRMNNALFNNMKVDIKELKKHLAECKKRLLTIETTPSDWDADELEHAKAYENAKRLYVIYKKYVPASGA
jgi:hypothetical protein